MHTANNHSVSFCLRAQPVLLQKEQGKCCRLLPTRLPRGQERLQRPSHTWLRWLGTNMHLENADGAAGAETLIRNSWTSVWLCQPLAMRHVSAAYQPRFLSRKL